MIPHLSGGGDADVVLGVVVVVAICTTETLGVAVGDDGGRATTELAAPRGRATE